MHADVSLCRMDVWMSATHSEQSYDSLTIGGQHEVDAIYKEHNLGEALQRLDALNAQGAKADKKCVCE